MRGYYLNHTAKTEAVEKAKDLHKEECERRLAQRMNTPKEKLNTPWNEPTQPAKGNL